MTQAIRRGLLILAVGVLLLPLVAVLLLESPPARHWLAGQVSQHLNGREVTIGGLGIGWGWPPTLRFADVAIANPDWAEADHLLDLSALEVVVDPGALLHGRLALERVHLERPRLHLARRETGESTWAGLFGGDDTSGGGGSGVRPDTISVSDGRITYRDPTLGADLVADVATRDAEHGPRQLIVDAQGRLRGRPLTMSARGGAPERALAPGAAYPLDFEANWGKLRAGFDGRFEDVAQLTGLTGRVTLSAPDDADLATLAGRPGLDLPALGIDGQLDYRERRLALSDLTAQLGNERIQGRVALAMGGRPMIKARLRADHLALERWGVTRLEQPDERQQAEQTLESVAWDRRWAERLAPLRSVDADVDLAVDRLSYGDTALDDVALQARLDSGRLSLDRLHLAQGGGAQGDGSLTSQGWLEIRPETLAGDIDTRLTRFDLGRALAPLGQAELGSAAGRLRLRIDEGALAFDDTSLDYRAPAQSLAIHVNAESAPLDGETTRGVNLQGSGTFRERDFAYDLTVGPLLDLDDPETPYPVQGTISADETRLEVNGSIEQPLALEAIDGHFRLAGPNPARLNRLTGLNLPALPPYDVAGEIALHGDRLRLQSLKGHFGNSDVAGDVRLELGERPQLWATLASQRLDLDDLAPLTGAAPDTGSGEQASAEQRQRAREEAASPGVFPDRRWNLAGLQRMDAEVRYRADSVSADTVPLTDVALDMSLDHGLLRLTPLRVGLGGGEVTAQVTLDARDAPLLGDLSLKLRQVNLKPLLERAGLPQIARDSAGVIGGQGKLSFRGNSLDESMAHLDGTLELAMAGGVLNALLLEGVGLDVAEGLMAALVDSDEVPMRCAYARLDARDGEARLEQFFIDTADSNLTGGGAIDLDAEQLDLVFEAHPKDPSLFASDSPVRLQGPMSDPGIDIVSRELVARGVLSALGALVAPPLAILPWVEPGLGEGTGSGCRQAVETSRQAGNAG